MGKVRIKKEKLRRAFLRSSYDRYEYCYQFTAFLAQVTQLFWRDDLSVDEQFEPVSSLMRCSPISSSATCADLTIYVAASRHAPFL
jgi:hypothetical protein